MACGCQRPFSGRHGDQFDQQSFGTHHVQSRIDHRLDVKCRNSHPGRSVIARPRLHSGNLGALNSLGSKILNPKTSRENIVLPDLLGLTIPVNDQMDFYLEMVRIAFTLDTHRVAVLGLGQGVTDWTWTNTLGETKVGNTFGNDFHHEIAHYGVGDSRLAYEG